jgi:hypothetical protein
VTADARPRTCARETPIGKLRALAAALRTGEPVPPEVARWAAEAIGQYEDDAAAGLTLDRALGLVPARGHYPWWRDEAIRRRDGLLRQLREDHFKGLGISVAAAEIARLFARRGRRGSGDLLGFDDCEALVDAALTTGLGALSVSRISEILHDEIGDFIVRFSSWPQDGTIEPEQGDANDGD